MSAKTPSEGNLISSYIEVTTRGGRLFADELRLLNQLTGKRIAQSRIRQYERGEFVPKSDVLNHMLETVLTDQLTSAGLTPTRAKRIVRACLLPIKIKAEE